MAVILTHNSYRNTVSAETFPSVRWLTRQSSVPLLNVLRVPAGFNVFKCPKANKHKGIDMSCGVHASADLRCVVCLSVYANVDLRSPRRISTTAGPPHFSSRQGEKESEASGGGTKKMER